MVDSGLDPAQVYEMLKDASERLKDNLIKGDTPESILERISNLALQLAATEKTLSNMLPGDLRVVRLVRNRNGQVVRLELSDGALYEIANHDWYLPHSLPDRAKGDDPTRVFCPPECPRYGFDD